MFGGFSVAKCDIQVQLCLGRIKIQCNKKLLQIRANKKEVAELLSINKTDNALIRVEGVIRETEMIKVYEILELYLELVKARTQLISKSTAVPSDMIEAVSSIIYASHRISDLDELGPLRAMFTAKFGKEFATGAASDMTSSRWSVNDKVIKGLLVEAPPREDKLAMLKDIAREAKIEFDFDSAFPQDVVIPIHPSQHMPGHYAHMQQPQMMYAATPAMMPAPYAAPNYVGAGAVFPNAPQGFQQQQQQQQQMGGFPNVPTQAMQQQGGFVQQQPQQPVQQQQPQQQMQQQLPTPPAGQAQWAAASLEQQQRHFGSVQEATASAAQAAAYAKAASEYVARMHAASLSSPASSSTQNPPPANVTPPYQTYPPPDFATGSTNSGASGFSNPPTSQPKQLDLRDHNDMSFPGSPPGNGAFTARSMEDVQRDYDAALGPPGKKTANGSSDDFSGQSASAPPGPAVSLPLGLDANFTDGMSGAPQMPHASSWQGLQQAPAGPTFATPAAQPEQPELDEFNELARRLEALKRS